MKILIKALLVISTLISLVIFLFFALALIGWLSDVDNVFFPGLGLVVAMPLVVVSLLIMLIISAFITALLARVVFKRLP